MLISFEGIDGSGKTTQITLLRRRLESEGIPVDVFREPGGSEVSELIRGMLLNPDLRIDPVTELLLFSAARSQLIAEQVVPRLEKGITVILDRFYDSTVAYQGYGRQAVDIARIHTLNAIAAHGLTPDLTFYLRIGREQADGRLSDRRRDRMEQAGADFFDRVVAGFDAMARSEPRFRLVDATRTPEDVHALIWKEWADLRFKT